MNNGYSRHYTCFISDGAQEEYVFNIKAFCHQLVISILSGYTGNVPMSITKKKMIAHIVSLETEMTFQFFSH